METVRTVDELVDALGGNKSVADIVGLLPSAVCNWRARGRVPPEHFMIVSGRLRLVGLGADPSLFGFSEARAG